MYPTQCSIIVIEVKYCDCPTSELNGWVIFVGKKSNYELSQNCLRERRTLGMFFFSTFLLSLSCFLMSFFPFSCSSSPFSLLLFRPLFTVSLLSLFSCFTLFYAFFRSVYYLPTLITFFCPSFLSFTLFNFLPLCPLLICIIFIWLFFVFCFCFFWYFML